MSDLLALIDKRNRCLSLLFSALSLLLLLSVAMLSAAIAEQGAENWHQVKIAQEPV